jgi:putative phosphoribosyl transferase
MILFENRQKAAELLAEKLHKYKARKDTIVLGIPRGGVVLASIVSKALKLPQDVVITRKIGAPVQKELAVGAVSPDGQTIWDNELLSQLGLTEEGLQETVKSELQEIKRRESLYRRGKDLINVEGKTVIVIDDGLATGTTAHAAMNYLKTLKPKKIILAVPVGAKDSMDKLFKLVEVVSVFAVDNLQSVGNYYQDFSEITDDQVLSLLS